MSIVSHHFLFKSISTTTATEATDLSSKAMLLDKIVDRLGSSARMEEFIALAEVYERQKDLSKLRALVSRIKSMLLVPHIYVWNCLLRVTLAKKDYPAAVALFDMLRESSMVPVTKSLSSAAPIAATYLPMLRYRHVVDLFEELQSSFPISSLSSPPPQRLSACYLAVIFALEKLNQVDRIVTLYETDPRDHDCVRNRMLDAISRDARFIPQAFKIFNLEKELDNVSTAGTYSSDLLNAHSYRIMIAMCCRFVDLQDPKLLDTALMLLERMKHEFQHKSNLSAYSAVVYTVAKQVTNGGSGSRNWMRVLEEKYSEMVAVFGVVPIQPMLHQNVITAFISNSNTSSKDNNSESLDSAYESLKFISQVTRTLLRSSSALVSKHSSETLTLDVTSMEAAIGTLISAYSNNSKMASKESILETCHKIFLDYKPSSSKAVDAMVLAITTHFQLLSFLVSIQGIWRLLEFFGRRRRNGEPLDALIRCLESEWSHRRVYLILKTGRAGAPAVAGVDAVEWSEAGLSREDVEDVHGFAIEAGRRCAL
ncbi:hypothetical protein BDR26DRAFT_854263 [Obelidium mucronatum]|nr:hypothetical protein BDR26DRAFT_854263 [Obelidium mucronatum]